MWREHYICKNSVETLTIDVNLVLEIYLNILPPLSYQSRFCPGFCLPNEACMMTE